jgi:ABC-type transporter Mla subunit MlaD
MAKHPPAKRPQPKMPPAVQEAYRQLQSGVKGLGKSVAEIQRSLRKAERKIEADGRARIRALRQDARAQLTALQAHRTDISRTLKQLAAAAGGSWQDLKQSADATLGEARATAASVIERFRSALGG